MRDRFRQRVGVSPLWLAAVPGLLAIGIWAVVDLQRFLLVGVVCTMVFPRAVANPGGTQVAIADVLLLVGLGSWLIKGAVGHAPRVWLSGNPLLVPSLLFVAVNVASLLWSVSPHETLIFAIQLAEIVVVIPLVFASVPTSVEAVRRSMHVFVGLTCALAAVTAVLYVPRALAGDLEGQYLPGMNKNGIGSFVAAGLVVVYALWLCALRPRVKRLLALAGVVEVAGLFATVSRGSIIGAFFAMIAISLLLRRKRALTLGTAAVCASLFLTTIGVHSGVDRSQKGSYDSSVVRSYSFSHAIDKIQARPFFGTGAGTYKDYIPQVDLSLPDPNNMFLLTWAELGIMGMLALGFLLCRFGSLLRRASRLPDSEAGPAVAAGAVTISLLVHFQLDVTWTRGTTSIAFAMMGVMIAVMRLAAGPAAAEERAVTRDRRRLETSCLGRATPRFG